MMFYTIKLQFVSCLYFVCTTWAQLGDESSTNTPLVVTTEENGFESVKFAISAEDLITEGESWFDNEDLEGYDVFHQDVDRNNNVTSYVHKEIPSIIYKRNRMDSMQKLIILENDEDGLPLIDTQTRIVFRQSSSHPKYYTGHIAYIRIFRGRYSVEWDILSHEKEKPQEIFAAAFTPFTFGINSIVRESSASNVTNKQGRLLGLFGKPKPKNPVNQNVKKAPQGLIGTLGSLFGLNRKPQTDEESAQEKPNDPNSEENLEEKPNEKPDKKSEEEKPNEMNNKKSEKEKSNKKSEKTPNEKPVDEKPDKIAQPNQVATQKPAEVIKPEIWKPIQASEEDTYIPTNEPKSTRRPSVEKVDRVGRAYFPMSPEEDIISERKKREDTPQTSNENSLQKTASDTSIEKHEEVNKEIKEMNSQDVVKQDTDLYEENKQTKGNKRPIIIPDKIFESSLETSVSIELPIEDGDDKSIKRNSGEDEHKSGRVSGFSRYKKSRYKRLRARNLIPIGTFFGAVNLNDSAPEKWMPEVTDNYLTKEGRSLIANHKFTSIIVVDYNENEHPLFEDRSSPYTGILTCPYENVSLSSGVFFELTQIQKMQLADFLLKSLRAQCLAKMRENTLNLFLEEMVTLGQDMKMYLNKDNQLYRKKTLDRQQWNKVISAIYFSIYSDAYRQHAEQVVKTHAKNKSPDFLPISQSLRTLTSVVIRGMEIIHDLETHAVKISKSLIDALNERYLLTLKEAEYLDEECNRNCQELMDINYQDRIQIRALKEFIIFGVEDTFGKKGSEMDNAFTEFYTKRLPILTGKSKDT